jgi:hypothetical protein
MFLNLGEVQLIMNTSAHRNPVLLVPGFRKIMETGVEMPTFTAGDNLLARQIDLDADLLCA